MDKLDAVLVGAALTAVLVVFTYGYAAAPASTVTPAGTTPTVCELVRAMGDEARSDWRELCR